LHKLTTKISLIAAVLLAAVTATVPAHADKYPNRPIHMLIPLATGSAVDIVARLVAVKMSQSLGQQIYVENLAGAAGLIGAERGAKAAPDGYTILAVNDSIMTMLPHLHAKVPYDALKDFAPITQLASISFVLVANPSFPANNVRELIALAKAKPGSINFASGGNGSPQHLAMELFKSATGTDLVHVSYKGATPALLDVVSGQVPIMFTALSVAAPFAKEGKLKILGAAGAKRNAAIPDVPTVAEQGVPGFDFATWGALIAPAGTAKDEIALLNREAVKALANPEVKERLAALGFEMVGNSPEQFAAALKNDFAKMAKVIKESGAKID
jgi:tripartite-type tricarboxylate transporter receptor subunit TctC